MKFTAALTPLALFVSSVRAATVTVSFDQFYDDASEPLTSVACSDGPFGLLTKGYTTFGSLPGFPNIGGADAISGYGSPSCGTCWRLTFEGRSINVLAIDRAGFGFSIVLQAMDRLSNGRATSLGHINADATRVSGSQCGL